MEFFKLLRRPHSQGTRSWKVPPGWPSCRASWTTPATPDCAVRWNAGLGSGVFPFHRLFQAGSRWLSREPREARPQNPAAHGHGQEVGATTPEGGGEGQGEARAGGEHRGAAARHSAFLYLLNRL